MMYVCDLCGTYIILMCTAAEQTMSIYDETIGVGFSVIVAKIRSFHNRIFSTTLSK